MHYWGIPYGFFERQILCRKQFGTFRLSRAYRTRKSLKDFTNQQSLMITDRLHENINGKDAKVRLLYPKVVSKGIEPLSNV